ncbi:hypothetical protein E9993_05725 [Labilibacter sediminis]|nr:hypothetical protein E9993_05725 [Labilibacter sediminis]
MKHFRYLSLFLVASVLTSCNCNNQVKVETITFKGLENSVEIKNQEIHLIVAPEIGRIVYYGFAEEDNLLFLNHDIENIEQHSPNKYLSGELKSPHYGGDRVLPTSEDYTHLYTGSRFIPDPWITCTPYDYELLKNGVKITSQLSDILGVRLSRTITIDKTGTQVHIHQKLKKLKNALTEAIDTIPLTIWNLSQIKYPQNTWMPLANESVFEKGFNIPVWPDAKNWGQESCMVKDNLLTFTPHPEKHQKVAADAQGWVAGLIDNVLMIERFTPLKGVRYPDGGTSASIYSCSLFAELECLSPEKILNVGEEIQHTITWELQKIKQDDDITEILKRL